MMLRPAGRRPHRSQRAQRKVGSAVLAAFAFLFGSAQTQSPVFSTKVEVVRVDALVTDGARPVLGLGPADFEVLDNGVPQAVEFVSYDQIPLNVVLAFDISAIALVCCVFEILFMFILLPSTSCCRPYDRPCS